MELRSIFDYQGNFKEPFNPYCESEDERYKLLFDEDGNLNYEAEKFMNDFIHNNIHDIGPFSDIVCLYHADIFSGNTKGNYSTIYYWR